MAAIVGVCLMLALMVPAMAEPSEDAYRQAKEAVSLISYGEYEMALKRLGMDNVASENGRVYFTGTEAAVAAANINLRIGERVLIELGRFDAVCFEELFQGVKALP